MEVDTISGINSLGIYENNGVRYFLFGDIHGQNLNNCDDKYNCDYFNYQFTETKTYYTNCTTIGPLLYNWFQYNDKHGIETNFYLEETYDSQTIYQYYLDIIIKRENYETLSTIFPDNELSWMQLMRYILQNKKYEYVHIHNIDIRFMNHQRISPFHIQFLLPYLEYEKDILQYIRILVLNYEFILKSLLTKNYQLNTLFEFILSKASSLKPIFATQFQMINLLVKNNTYLIGEKINNPQIIDFILLLAQEHMNDIRDITIDNIDYFIALFNTLAAYTMDAYVLAEIFLNQGEEVIVYTGAAHIEVYHLFFQNYLNWIPIYDSGVGDKCITFKSLPQYLNVNKYRDIILKENGK